MQTIEQLTQTMLESITVSSLSTHATPIQLMARSKQHLKQLTASIEANCGFSHWEAEVEAQDGVDEYVDMRHFKDDKEYTITITAYPHTFNEVDYEGLEELEEAKKRIKKVNSKGVKRIKIKCDKGFKYVPNSNGGGTCVKISGSEKAMKRLSSKKMVRSKNAQGDGLKRRTDVKTKKANRHRKSYGL